MRIPENHWLKTTPIAHRGLWGEGIAENSLSAYNMAVECGFAIEIDVWASKDGVLYSFHDGFLKRMTGKDGHICEFESSYINSLKLVGTDEKIPTLREVLFAVNGKVPLLIEIKNQPDKQIVERVLEELDEYQGEFAIQSFNPLYINKVKKIAPHIIRGILGTADATGEKWLVRKIVKNLSLNFMIKPDFIAMRYNDLPLKKSKTKNKIVLAWTVTDQEIWDKVKAHANNLIFEKFIPNGYL